MGANRFFFNPDAKLRHDGTLGELTVREKRRLFASHTVGYPGDAPLLDGYISPVAFCDLAMAEGVFRDARHYFNLVSKGVESFRDIANLLGDGAFYTDDEMFLIVRQICRDNYGNARPEILPMESKLELARRLRFDYKLANRQIQRLLRLDGRVLDALWGR